MILSVKLFYNSQLSNLLWNLLAFINHKIQRFLLYECHMIVYQSVLLDNEVNSYKNWLLISVDLSTNSLRFQQLTGSTLCRSSANMDNIIFPSNKAVWIFYKITAELNWDCKTYKSSLPIKGEWQQIFLLFHFEKRLNLLLKLCDRFLFACLVFVMFWWKPEITCLPFWIVEDMHDDVRCGVREFSILTASHQY